jgi:OmpA-OmpF porin, OOP family
MRNWLSTAAGVATLALLVGCSGSTTPAGNPSGAAPPGGVRQFVTLPENWAFAFQAEPVMREARSLNPGGSAFQRSLYEGYMEHAEYDYGPLMMDFRDAIYHARKAVAAARGTTPEPTALTGERVLPADKVDELSQARSRLVAALAANATTTKPEEAGKAQAFFDCWMEQQEENFQPKDIEYCRNGFFANLEAIEVKPATDRVPEVISLSADVLFDFDRSTLRANERPELDQIAELLVRDTTTNVLVWGYTDTAGPQAYNQRLSERRAETVARYLESKGVSRSRMQIRGWGETNLAVQTPDNTPEQRNRRVEIRRR